MRIFYSKQKEKKNFYSTREHLQNAKALNTKLALWTIFSGANIRLKYQKNISNCT